MPQFFEDLFNSIFTPGPTTTLLKATNASFGALQLILLLLLAGTRSVHFAILSVLCSGLWWAINWFAAEILKAQQEQANADTASKAGTGTSERKELRAGSASAQGSTGMDGEAADSEDTETEAEVGKKRRGGGKKAAGASMAGSSSGLKPQSEEARKRLSTGDVSGTDSEWEKLSASEVKG